MASRFLRSVRGRTTLGATVVVAVALLIGAFSFYGVLSASIHGARERAAELRLEELVQRFEGPGRPGPELLDDDIVQLIGRDGTVRRASEEAQELLGSGSLPVHDDPRSFVIDGERMVVVSDDLDDGESLVLAVPMEDDAETLATVATLLAVAVPALLVLVAATTWLVTGRALRPVSRIRTEVDGITAERLDRRVPVPDTGDEIASLATTMNGMLDRLDAAATAQRRFVSDASHELRSPLATIRQHAELAQSHPEVTSIRELADVVSEEGLRLQGIVESLLLLARLDEGVAGAAEPVDLDDIALTEVRRLRAAGLDVDGSGIGAARVS
ncbi:histidine kinase dimerization/phospho-acceptor domain-containing protein, partial [Microbacterium sp. K41]|uniref:histidine kinase dimerization/phospho-acceptor domain-containing protein n=1 Tax=Microbacterium sp. K41 TaxID=2305437 RepID=UPI001F0FA1EC